MAAVNDEYQRAYRVRNKARIDAYHRALRQTPEYKAKRESDIALRRAFVDAARANGCVDCGNKNLTVLDSDHVKSGKLANLSRMVVQRSPLSVIFEELDKCETVCSNCHRIRTAARRRAA